MAESISFYSISFQEEVLIRRGLLFCKGSQCADPREGAYLKLLYVLHQLIIPLIFFFILFTCQLDTVLISYLILSWSLMGDKGLTILRKALFADSYTKNAEMLTQQVLKKRSNLDLCIFFIFSTVRSKAEASE